MEIEHAQGAKDRAVLHFCYRLAVSGAEIMMLDVNALTSSRTCVTSVVCFDLPKHGEARADSKNRFA